MTGTDTETSTKSRGCRQCTKRRIVCDKAEPTCQKCLKKGIECSGLGRFRFGNGVATRGKLKGSAIPVLNVDPQSAYKDSVPIASSQIRWCHERKKRVKKNHASPPVAKAAADTRADTVGRSSVVSPETCVLPCTDGSDPRSYYARSTEFPSVATTTSTAVAAHEATLVQESAIDPLLEGDADHVDTETAEYLTPRTNQSFQPWIASLSSRALGLFDYFAKNIAPVMVLLDISNGYRDFILPMACQDEVLQRAVAVVAAQHIGLRQPALQAAAEADRSAIITRLLRASNVGSPDQVFNPVTWATLLVLLVGETVTGSPESYFLLQTLFTLAKNVRSSGHPELHEFLVRQTDMFSFLGRSLLNKDEGLKALSNPVDSGIWLPPNVHSDAQHGKTLSLARRSFTLGAQIYLLRLTSDESSWHLREELRCLISQAHPTDPGAHGFVWPCFIAAADSTEPEHRAFFIHYMKAIHSNTLFANIPKAIDALPAIWESQSRNWTESLSGISRILIM
ncbi:Zn(II)2Cys6 transcription factor [Aspergillus saccharolyticus JOP 1030-1]|uniref:Zn(2)-C6 fungal-type domain-containing protein n=1 Tax=Aspergillus saccharolyticus JOP 1030-1 TaxID=1450539 RepID=A0A318ZKG5_9EURO|nr:hypothetical protein BP01DRAFT_379998 [Aspergillus saccharolyticus JOP 1030-1]PYH48081.1 hypothetical protein BP01DRAFT_379998 [Aspergillus saccharolyticus JOP 1030-1]